MLRLMEFRIADTFTDSLAKLTPPPHIYKTGLVWLARVEDTGTPGRAARRCAAARRCGIWRDDRVAEGYL